MYSDYLSISPIFQTSINIEYDLNNEDKISQYIPTKEGCRILRTYLEMIVPQYCKPGDIRSTVLLGPYGKGKSFLLLVLLYILSSDPKKTCYKNLIAKIKRVDEDLAAVISELNKNQIKLMPVLINSDYNNLKQAFRVALSDALSRNGFDDLIPNSAFSVASEVVQNWIDGGFEKETRLKKCLNKKQSLATIKAGLDRENVDSYNLFLNIYSCISGGVSFNPLIKDDIANTLRDTAAALSDRSYSGIFIVFDEFSKFLESGVPNLMEQLSMLQNIFELSSRSGGDNQIHICCVTHKELAFYHRDFDTAKVSAFRAVEGRVKQIRFAGSLQESYSLISESIIKKKSFNKFYDSVVKSYSEIYDLYKANSKLGDSVFLDETVFRNCFPLNPFSVNALISLSERFAQNERTLFTFIADSDRGSLRYFINNHDDGLIGLDSLYDYFLPLLKKDDDKKIKNICYRSEACLSNADDGDKEKLIKAIAIASIIDNSNMVPQTKEYLFAATGLSKNSGLIALQALENDSKVKVSVLSDNVSFASSNSSEIDKAVGKYIAIHGSSFNLQTTIESLSDDKYVIPRRYNIINKIVRYYKNIYIDEDVLFSLNSLNFLFDKKMSDGIVVNIIRKNGSSHNQEDVERRISEVLDDDRIIVKCPRKLLDDVLISRIKEYWALVNISSDDRLSLEKEELSLILNDLKWDLSQKIAEVFKSDFDYFPQKDKSFFDLINDSFSETYSDSPIVNNEMLNKHTLSSQYKKARNAVVDCLLGNGDFDNFSPTGPEMTVFNSVFDSADNNIEKSLNTIADIIKASGPKTSFSSFVDVMLEKPFGIREGVLPLLIAKVLSDLPGCFTVFYKNRFVLLTPSILSSAVETPSEYSFTLDSDATDKIKLVDNLLEIFGVKEEMDFWKKLTLLSNTIRRYCSNFPIIIRTATNGIPFGISSQAIDFKNAFIKFDINPYEAIFETIPSIAGMEDLSNVDGLCKFVYDVKSELDNAFDNYVKKIIHIIKECFKGNDSDSIHALVEFWVSGNNLKDKKFEFKRSSEKSLADILIRKAVSFDDEVVANMIAKAITGHAICDWTQDKASFIRNGLEDFCSNVIKSEDDDYIKKSLKISDVKQLSPLGNTLKNYLSSNIAEFGESLSPAEIAQVLLQLIKEVC